MKIHVPQFLKFDQARVGKETLYIFPLPHGYRCLAKTNGTEITVHRSTGEDITGFAPEVEDALKRVYLSFMSEPNSHYTVKGVQVVFPDIVFDIIIHDRATCYEDDGKADDVRNAMQEDWDLIGAPIANGKAKATILSHMLLDEYENGRCPRDIWWQRAEHKRGIIGAGIGIPSTLPRPVLTWLVIAPRAVGLEEGGVAAHSPSEVWNTIYAAFQNRSAGALIVDVWQGWKVGSSAFQVLKEDDIEI